jgi:ABC transport system ATP-binding/permease protein
MPKPAAAAAAPKAKKLSYKEQREFEALEKDIPALEAEKESITARMSSGALLYDELQALTARITEVTRLLEEKEFRWLELSEGM